MTSTPEEVPIPTRLGNSELVGHLEDGSEEWHNQRANGVGSSEVASCADLPGAFKSKYVLWLEKCGYYTPPEPNEETAEMFRMGHLMENLLDEYLLQDRPHEIPLQAGSWRHVDNHSALLNPDRLVWDTQHERWRGREYKASARGFDNEQPPLRYIAQCEWCRGSLGLDEWELFAAVAGSSVKAWTIKPGVMGAVQVTNQKTGHAEQVYGIGYPSLLAAAESFIQSVRDKNPPPVDGSIEGFDYIKSQVSQINPAEDAYLDWQMAYDLHYADQQAKTWTKELTRVKSLVLEEMGEAKFAKLKPEMDGKEGVTVARRQLPAKGKTPTLYLSTSRAAKQALNLDIVS